MPHRDDDADDAGGGGVHGQPCHRQDNAHEIGIPEGGQCLLTTTLTSPFTISLKGIKFPIICDRDGDFSRAFGVLKLSGGNFGAARAVFDDFFSAFHFHFFRSQVAVLDPEKRLIHLRLHNERTRARFLSLLQSTSINFPSQT